MSIRRVIWVALFCFAAIISIWAICNLLSAPQTKRSDAARKLPPQSASTPDATDITGGKHWNDPSVDPEVLKRAFSPPPKSIPPEERPKPASLYPTKKRWRELQKKDSFISY